jgi:hypothetical protein
MHKHAGNEILLSETLTIVLLAIFGCLFSFLYEIGYFIVFGIPFRFLGINLHNILIFILATFSAGIFALPVIYLIFKRLSIKNKLSLYNYLLLLIIPFDLLMIMIYLFTKSWNLFILIVVLLLSAIFSKFLLTLIFRPIRYHYSIKNETPRDVILPIYSEYNVKINPNVLKNAVQEEVRRDIHPDRTRQARERKATIRAYIIAMSLMIMLSIISSAIGIIQAVTDEEYYIVNTSPEMVVLRIYDGKLICAPFDRISKKIYRNFVIKNIGEYNLVMTMEKIGPFSKSDY